MGGAGEVGRGVAAECWSMNQRELQELVYVETMKFGVDAGLK